MLLKKWAICSEIKWANSQPCQIAGRVCNVSYWHAAHNWDEFPEQHCPNKWSESPHENLASPARSGWNGKCLVFVPDILFCTPLRLHSVWHGLNFDYLLGQCLGFVKYPTIFGCVMTAIAQTVAEMYSKALNLLTNLPCVWSVDIQYCIRIRSL